MKKIISEFKEFISRGNVVDLAVGVIVGGAFSKIVTSLVNDVLTPLIGIVLGGVDFSSLSLDIKSAKIMYGSFIQNIIDFLIIASCVFLFVKLINTLSKKNKKEEVKVKEAPKKSDDILLLEEIRDLLKENKKTTTKRTTKK